MKLTKQQLKQLIKEEIQQSIDLDEGAIGDYWRAATGQSGRSYREVPADKPGFDDEKWGTADPPAQAQQQQKVESLRDALVALGFPPAAVDNILKSILKNLSGDGGAQFGHGDPNVPGKGNFPRPGGIFK